MEKELIEAARREDWDYVDKRIPQVCNDRSYIEWARRNGINDPDGNVRDLAVSILEKADIPADEFRGMAEELHKLMVSDNNPYVRFRSAFALANHDPGNYRKEVVGVLEEAEKDEDVAALAKGYLKKMEE
jgi:HEAT repeat protein